MKNFYKVSNTIENGPRMDRKRTVVGPMKDRQKSRISPINHRLWTVIAPMLFLAFGLFGVNESAWGGNVAETTTTIFNKSKSATGNGITFSKKGTHRIDLWDKYAYLKSGEECYFEWSGVPTGYTINVSQVVINTYNVRLVGTTGQGHYKTSKNPTYVKFCQDNSDFKPYTLNSTSYFSLGNGENVYIKAVDRELQIKDIVFTYTIGNNYSIAFNANGGSGSMDNLTMVYYISKNLTANAFSRAYTVSYDVNKGTLDAALTSANTASNYTFAGWATSADGEVVYTNQASVSNLTETVNGTYNLYAKWSNGGVTLPAGSKDGYFLEGWYDGEIRVGHPGDTYYPTANVELKANWVGELNPEFEGEDLEDGLKVGANYTSFVFRNVSAAIPTNNSLDNFYYIIDNVSVNGNTTDCAAGTADKVISYNPATNTLTALNAGTADITFYQKAVPASHIVANSQKFTIEVTKNDPEFSWTTQTYYYNSSYANIFSSTNHDTQLTCSTTNDGAAEMVDGTNSYQKTLKTYNGSSATITIEQAENYYWNYKKVDDYDVDNNRAANHVAFTYNEAMYNSNTITTEKVSTYGMKWDASSHLKLGGDGTGITDAEAYNNADKYVIVHFAGIPDKLSFVYRTNTGLAAESTADWYVAESKNGTDWNTIWTDRRNSSSWVENAVVKSLSTSTRYIKLCYSGNFAGYFKDVNVTELQYFRRKGENTTLDFATNLKNHVPEVQSFVVEHANAGYQTSVTAPEHYQVSLDNVNFASEVVYSTNETAETAGDKMGTFTVYVKYLADAEGTHPGNVTVHNNLRDDFNVPVTGTTQGKLSTTLHYIGASAYNADTTNLVATDLFEVHDPNGAKVEGAVITLTTGTSTSVKLATDNKSIAELCGNSNDGTTGNVTASYAGDGTHEAATNNGLSQNFTINRLNDEVSFDSGYESMVVGEEIDLTEWATSCTSGTDITVTSVFKDYIVIEDGKVKAVAKGNGRLRAASAGDCTYNSGVKFLNIAVRNPEDPCESSLLYSSKLIKVGAYEHTSSSPVTYVIPDGPQDKLTFKVWRVPAATKYATLEILDKNDNVLTNGTFEYTASSLPSSEPDAPNKEINMADYPGAKKLRFYGWGTLNKYFSEVRISQKAYLTASTSSVTMSTVQACDTAKGQFTVDYSDVSHIQLSQTNNDFSYEVWDGETKLIGFENGCKSYGTYTVKFFYVPQAKGPYSNTVTISASGKEQVITLSGTANKPDRTIVWDIPTGNTITATQSLDLTAYAETSCQSPAGSVYYTASPADAVTIDPTY